MTSVFTGLVGTLFADFVFAFSLYDFIGMVKNHVTPKLELILYAVNTD